MSEQVSKRKPGRPRIELDRKQIEDLASIGCTISEIASVMNCSRDTITDNYSAEIQKGQENGKTRLRKAQLKAALGGNVTMLIWLGKQMLGQSEKIEQKTEHSGELRHGNILTPTESKAVKEWVDEIKNEVRAKLGDSKQ